MKTRKSVAIAVVVFAVAAMAAATSSKHNQQGGTMNASAAKDELSKEIYAREVRHWKDYQRGDIAAHNALLTADFRAVEPDGTLHVGVPSAKEIAAIPISGFRFSDFRVEPLATDAALTTYVADVDAPGSPPVHVRFAVVEVWVRQAGEWKCRFYQATFTK